MKSQNFTPRSPRLPGQNLQINVKAGTIFKYNICRAKWLSWKISCLISVPRTFPVSPDSNWTGNQTTATPWAFFSFSKAAKIIFKAEKWKLSIYLYSAFTEKKIPRVGWRRHQKRKGECSYPSRMCGGSRADWGQQGSHLGTKYPPYTGALSTKNTRTFFSLRARLLFFCT